MASITKPKSIASLMRISLEHRSSLEKARFQLVPRQTQSVLLDFLQNNNVHEYNEFILKLKTFDITDENFKILLEDCCNCVCFLGKTSNEFVGFLCRLSWVNRPTELMQLYQQFILNLVTAQMFHTPIVFSSILCIFKNGIDMWENQPSERNSENWDSCHALLARILKEIPLSKDVLTRCILEQYPYHKAGISSNRAYVYNLLLMTKYLPELTEQIIAVIINRMVVLDVSIDSKQTNRNECIFSMDMDKPADEMADTIDYCMVELLQWLDSNKLRAVDTIFNISEKILLPTYGTHYVQFLLFYAISINQNCGDRTLSLLWAVATGHHIYGVSASSLRCTAIVHLSGLIARASKLPKTRLIHYLKLASDWCHNYITATQECITSPADMAKAHAAFYAISEAVFYLVAFKHQQLFGDRKALTFVESLNLPRLATCTLNPLKFCSPHIATAFASVTRSYQVAYCHTLLERNARNNFVTALNIQHNQWFPYDPYTLPRSGKWIWPLYSEYEEWTDSKEMDVTEPETKLRDVEEDDFLATSPIISASSSFSKYDLPGFKHDI